LILIVLIFPGNAIGLFKEGLNVPAFRKIIPNELIVKFKQGLDPFSSGNSVSVMGLQENSTSGSLRLLFSQYKITKVKAISPSGAKSSQIGTASISSTGDQPQIYKLSIGNSCGLSESDVAKQLANDPGIEYAEPNYLFCIFRSPNDPYYSRQWGLSKIGAAGGWDAQVGKPEVVIAVVDTGVDYNHPDLASNIWCNSDEIAGNGIDDDSNGYVDDVRGWDFVSVPPSWVAFGEDAGPEDNDPMDFVGHGTHVSGIAAGRSNNSLGTAGMAWNSKIMPVRAGYASYDGWGYLEYFDAGRAIIYAADNGADVINMSWGGLDDSSFVSDAINYAYSKGCVLVAAAGNVSSSYAGWSFYPAAYPPVVAVSATDNDDMLSIWSWSVFSNFGGFVDVCAPGTDVLSTLPGATYGSYSGTSMAAPFVSGLAALVKARYPSFDNAQIIERIKSTADNVDGANPDFLCGQMGAGRVNAHKSLGGLLIGIDYPKGGAKVGNKILIKGSADVENFSSYEVSYSSPNDPLTWFPIGPVHNSPVAGGVLENWNADGLLGSYAIRVTVADTSGESYVSTSNVYISSKADVDIVSPPLPGPNPFDPTAGQIKIYYELGTIPSSGVDVALYIYDITGTLIYKTKKFSSSAGPVTDVFWDGRSAFGKRVGTGVYPFYLVCDNKIIGKNKIAVAR
jgi:subtilisin family serine protease